MQTHGPWSPEEKQWHINCLEDLAAFHAVKCFVRDGKSITVLLRMDNTAAVAYVNKLEEQYKSPKLNITVRELWLWCMNRDITLVAEHLPGILNTTADKKSRVMRDRSDWMLNPMVFHKIQQKWDPHVCIQTDNTAKEVLQLETKSRSRSSGCFQPAYREEVMPTLLGT